MDIGDYLQAIKLLSPYSPAYLLNISEEEYFSYWRLASLGIHTSSKPCHVLGGADGCYDRYPEVLTWGLRRCIVAMSLPTSIDRTPKCQRIALRLIW